VAAVLALRRLHTPRAKAWLIGAASGSDRTVAGTALSALFEQSLTRDELVRLAELVLGGCTLAALDARILRLLLSQRSGAGTLSSIVDDAVSLLLRYESGELAPPTRRSATESLRPTMLPSPPAPAESEIRPRSAPPGPNAPLVNTASPIKPLAVL
jgi:hypothetical protein